MHPSTCSLLLEIFHFSFVSPLSSNNFSLLRSFTFLFSFPGVCVWGGDSGGGKDTQENYEIYKRL